MSVDLSVTEEEMQESEQAPNLREAYIGPVDLVNIEEGDPENYGGNDVLVFTFEALDEDYIGQQFDHVEWPITQQDINETDANDQSNAEIQLRRLVHILSRVLAVDSDTVRESIVFFRGDTISEAWDNLRERVIKAYNKFGKTGAIEERKVHAKVFARVGNNGYVNVRFGKYPGFIRVVGKDPKLEFTQWERNQNEEARQALNNSPDSGDEFDDDFDDFDDDDFDAEF